MCTDGTSYVVYVLGRLQEEYRAKGKMSSMCFVDLEEAFDRSVKNSVGLRDVDERNAKVWIDHCLISMREQ